MRITKHKGKPQKRSDWEGLDQAVEGLKINEDLRVYPPNGQGVTYFQRRVSTRYIGITTMKRKNYVIVTLQD